ncbi:hypothetical protein BJV77DRAFT_699397 [Russula vinacea]|nr:hypothetical protein BJV77DRAFT_699397 [Russula vinacea]
MKEKKQFINMGDSRQQDAAGLLNLYLDALDEELVTLRSSISVHKSASTLKVEEPRKRLGQARAKLRWESETARQVQSSRHLAHIRGRTRTTLRAPNQPDTVTAKDWRLLQLDIQPDSVHSIQDLFVHISQPQPLQVGQSSSSRRASNCKSRHFRPFSSSILSAFCMMRPGWHSQNPQASSVSAGARNLTRGHGTYRRKICGVGELQAVRGALPPW